MAAARQELIDALLVEDLDCRVETIEPDGSTAPVGFDALRRAAHADLFAYRR
jgi:hypothetical protein